MSEQDDAKIQKLLKASPKLTPPESFYRGVLEQIERKSKRAEEPKSSAPPLVPSSAPWYWGYPAKALATACLLMLAVLVTRETRKTKQVVMLDFIESDPAKVMSAESHPAPASLMNGKELAGSKEVQNRLKQDIGKFVGHPSPFEDEAAPRAEPLSRRKAAVFAQVHDNLSQEASPQPATVAAKSLVGVRAQNIPAQFGLKDAPELQNTSRGLAKKSALGYGSGSSVAAELKAALSSATPAEREFALSTIGAAEPLKIQKGFEIAGPVSARKILEKPLPIYPAWAQEQGLEAIVRVYARILPAGNVDPNVRVTRTTGYPALDQLAIDAVKKWKFAPAQVDSWGIITFQFKPSN